MGNYQIQDLDSNIINYIKSKGIDKNKNGVIEKDNGELADLLSNKNIKEVEYVDSMWPAVGVLGTGFSFLSMGIIEDLFYKQNNMKANKKLDAITLGLAGLGAIASWTLPFILKNKKLVMEGTEAKQQLPQNNDIKQKFEQGFKELGVSEDTELKEYTPKKGEYWISILKAKYGVDDITAQKMANKIKEMIYDDAKAAKQTPVMYLPETWTFEGKTYSYNDKTEVSKTDNYSDEVKTEMGKMSKDLKYE